MGKDKQIVRAIEKEVADALLDVGVSVPLMQIKLPFRKPLVLRVTMKRPCLSGQIAIARTFLSIGVTSAEMEGYSKEEQMQFIAEHGREVSRLIALTLLRGALSRRLLTGITAWIIREKMDYTYMTAAITKYVQLMGTDPFTNIIRSVEMTNPLKPRLSQKRTES